MYYRRAGMGRGGRLWIMLAPLPPGEHTIHFTAQGSWGFNLDVTYRVTIK